jgi:hypothetical protein
MDFFGDLFDLGDRRHRKGHHDGHGHEYHNDHDQHNEHGYRNDDYQPPNYSNDGNRNDGPVKCVKCAGLLAESFNFCPNCGTAVPRAKKCISCGCENIPQAKFCSSCGTKVS